ncbi:MULTISPECIES: serine/threonine protein kinase [Psychrilyobacter]|uniref:Protein kinase domain-containing protein n=1 Tax=Psychrilyobacter piezotolerans TaxID=2293438 RepID=A0ABX9KJJ9_9FUSO|nr:MULTISPECIES: protein kinase [Psychrilyobacter]MCS5422206.1 protein kinase [Psychrilyobacter sp. S5]NDI77147.1 protein kinase [Psychrilyobacter piezotolerans]RDE64139.1 hypothetical protein DV867_04210 [Psychrilyobacter sp. S5]REI42231.1 hypothetical protein DYH56_04210 [Psychrilyobacter piezotolerans]
MKYIVIDSMKESGQRAVFLVDHEKYGRCILKKLPLSGIERALRECKWQADNESPYFPQNLDFGLDETKTFFYIYEEYIEGNTLEACIETFKNDEGKVINLLLHLIVGLQELWKEGHIHRDIKPANIICTDDLTPIILDLGITKFSGEASLTVGEFVPHTPTYASPEQLNCLRGLITFKTDLFSIGIILLEAYLGKHPFGENLEEIKRNIKNGSYTKPENCSESFSKLIDKLLSKEPFKRFRKSENVIDFIKEHWRDIYENFTPIRS